MLPWQGEGGISGSHYAALHKWHVPLVEGIKWLGAITA